MSQRGSDERERCYLQSVGCKDCALCLWRGRIGGRLTAAMRGRDSQEDRGIVGSRSWRGLRLSL
jgi:hypothetical protein